MLQERQYVVRVSALLDRSTSAAVADFVQQFERGHRQVARRISDTARLATQVARDQERTTARETRQQEQAQRYVAGIKERYFRDQQRAEERAGRDKERQQRRQATDTEKWLAREEAATAKAARNKQREHERSLEHVARVRERHLRDEQRQQEHAQAYVSRIKERHFREEQRRGERDQRDRADRVKQIAGNAYQNFAGVARRAVGVAGDVASGFGVDFSVARGVSKAVELEQLAIGIVNAGNRGEGTSAQRDAQAQALQTQARTIGKKFAFDPTQMLTGMAQFQAKTGDTKTAEAGLERFAKLAKAFNVELSDMISAAGEIGSKLEDNFKPGEERAQKIYEVLKLLTAQGQEGAIEIADLAKETARLGGGAGFFKGDIGSTIGKLGAFAQLARQTGGANSPADAARAVAAFVTTLKTPARRAAFERYGVEFKDKDGSFLDPLTIVKNALKATGGDDAKMNELFKSSLGTKPVDALNKAFRAGGGGEGGLKAVDELFAKFTRAASEDVIDENTRRAMGSKGSQAQLAQNEFDEGIAELTQQLTPALRDLVPVARDVTKAFTGVVAWAAKNPGEAITAAIVASIAKAAIGKAAGDALSAAINKGATPGAAGGGMSLLGKVGAGLTIATLAITTAKIGMAVIDDLFKSKEQAEDKTRSGDLQRDDAKAILRGAEKTGVIQSPADKEALQKTREMLQRRIALAQQEAGETVGGHIGAVKRSSENFFTGGPGYSDIRQAQADIPQIAQMQAEMAAIDSKLSALTAGTLTIKGTVEVSNMPAVGPGQNGRQGIPDQGG